MDFLILTAKISVEDYFSDGAQIWNSQRRNIKLVMSVPQEWDGAKRAVVRSAAVRALGIGIDPSQIMFMTEVEV